MGRLQGDGRQGKILVVFINDPDFEGAIADGGPTSAARR
jgi:hypothetical protein